MSKSKNITLTLKLDDNNWHLWQPLLFLNLRANSLLEGILVTKTIDKGRRIETPIADFEEYLDAIANGESVASGDDKPESNDQENAVRPSSKMHGIETIKP